MVTWTVLGVCVAVQLLRTFVPAVGQPLLFAGVQANELVSAGQWWRLLTAAFFHDGLTHIAFNMWALSIFGPQLERDVGSGAFAALYAAAALAGGAAFYLTQPAGVAVGASGAIFGLFGAWLAASYRSRHTLAGAASFRQLLVLLGINLALPLLPGSNIAWQAHLGGLAAGMLIAAAWTLPALRRSAALRAAAGAAVAAVALIAVLSGG
jgi:membrane associated rhomboid family serine protease